MSYDFANNVDRVRVTIGVVGGRVIFREGVDCRAVYKSNLKELEGSKSEVVSSAWASERFRIEMDRQKCEGGECLMFNSLWMDEFDALLENELVLCEMNGCLYLFMFK